MSRTIQEIINDSVDLLETKTDLWDVDESDPTKLSNPSNASVWYNWLGLFAALTAITEDEFDLLRDELEARALELPVGTDRWHQGETLKYQFGDTLVVVDGVPQYATVDEDNWVVDYASVVTQEGNILIKAAKDNAGVPEALSVAEVSGLEEYWLQKRIPGTAITIISQAGDKIRVTARIEVDGQLISSDGESLTESGVYPVEAAILDYIKELDFNGRFLVMKLEDAMQAVPGVENVTITSVTAQSEGSSSWVNVTAATGRAYIAVAGYMIEDDTIALRDTLTYVV